MPRCKWANSPLMVQYHDEEWGVPVHDDRVWFEFLVLEGAQAGLSWAIVLSKRAKYRQCFEGFDPARVAKFTPAKIEKILQDPGVVRNRLKIQSAVTNAKAFLAVQKEHGSFDRFIWDFVGGQPIVNRRTSAIPARTPLSDALSRELKRLGFKFVGTTICYAFMQATGLVNDHLVSCPCYARLARG